MGTKKRNWEVRTLAKSFASCPPALIIAIYASYGSAAQHKCSLLLGGLVRLRLLKGRLRGLAHRHRVPQSVNNCPVFKGDRRLGIGIVRELSGLVLWKGEALLLSRINLQAPAAYQLQPHHHRDQYPIRHIQIQWHPKLLCYHHRLRNGSSTSTRIQPRSPNRLFRTLLDSRPLDEL